MYSKRCYSSLILVFVLLSPFLFLIVSITPGQQDFDVYTPYHIDNSQESTIWNEIWGGSDMESGDGIWTDGTNVYVTGYTKGYGAGLNDLILLKYDQSGNKVWERTWGGSNIDSGKDVWGDGTYIYTTGITYSFGAGNSDVLLVKWDSNGNQIWNATWGGSDHENCGDIWGDGSYIYTCGSTSSYGAGDSDCLFIKWTTSGTVSTYDLWGGADTDWASGICGDGVNLYVCGSTRSYGNGGYDCFVAKWYDYSFRWDNTWGGILDDQASDMWTDGLYLYTTGFTENYGAGSRDLQLIKWNMNGNKIWNSTWGGPLWDHGNTVWGHGSFIYTSGISYSFSEGENDFALVKWDDNGNLVWSDTWGDVYQDVYQGSYGDGSVLYTSGYTSSGSSATTRDILVSKWSIDHQFDIDLAYPLENGVYESGRTINVDLEAELVFISSITYKWNSEDPEEWNEPYTTTLPSEEGINTLYVTVNTNTPYISASDSFTFIADNIDPVISILSPSSDTEHSAPPTYDLAITEANIDEIWYTLNGGSEYYVTNDVGAIDSSAWEDLSNGVVTIKFYVTDEAGHEVSKDVRVNKIAIYDPAIDNIIKGVIYGVGTGLAGLAFWGIKKGLDKRKKNK